MNSINDLTPVVRPVAPDARVSIRASIRSFLRGIFVRGAYSLAKHLLVRAALLNRDQAWIVGYDESSGERRPRVMRIVGCLSQDDPNFLAPGGLLNAL